MNDAPQVGDPAPDAELIEAPEGRAVLSSAWSAGTAVIVFLRYFGCPFCQMQVASLRDDRERFETADAEVVLVGQGSTEEAERFVQGRRLPFRCLVDPDRSAYRAYGLGRGTPAQVYGPRVFVPFVKANLTGHPQLGLRGGSFHQMPGSFVVDRTGTLRFVHRNRTVADTPPNQALLDAVAEIAGRV
ncbi:MAG TPA: peroxiredoxin-like family protein [Actinomycetota bacterium]|jgi:peroxiredoxin